MSSSQSEITNLPEQFERARQLQSQGDTSGAIAEYRSILEIDPENLAALHQLGQLSEVQGDFAAAVEHYQRAIEIDSEPPFWVYRHLGFALSQQDRLEEAVEAYQRAIELNPDEAQNYSLLGQVRGKQGNFVGAIESYQKAIELSEEVPIWVYLNLGEALSQEKQFEEAIVTYEKALSLEPDNVGIRQLLDKVTALHELSCRTDTDNVSEHFDRARDFQATGQLEEALGEYQKVLEGDRNYLAALHQIAQIYESQGKWEEAIEGYQKAIDLDANPPFWVYRHLGFALSQQERLDEAIEAYQRAIELNPEDAATYSLLGQAYRKMGNVEGAIENYQRAIALNPEVPAWVYFNLEEMLALQDPIEDKLPSIEAAKSTNSKLEKTPEKLVKINSWQNLSNLSRACLTIVSKNYLPLARVLCDTFLEHHPDAAFFVLLVDKVEEYFDPEREKFHLLTLEDINLPSSDTFPYSYTILELNTAVKPFALDFLFKKINIQKLLYIDPDIQVFRPLDEVWEALDTNSVVLTPHMRQPFWDNCFPSEVQILQSGTYNLGFIGLQNNASALSLLYWWMEKLYLDCVVDIPQGLFVDQKWMDLIPGYVPDTYILHDPSYNIAYWNLHERSVQRIEDRYFVEGKPLAFFHFSGYNPQAKNTLSKHQSRHDLRSLPYVKELCDRYGEKLIQQGYGEAKEWPYYYAKLPNGIKVNKFINFVIRQSLKHGINFPNPVQEPDLFCEFFMTPSPVLTGKDVPPIVTAILYSRPDVAAYYPDAESNFQGSGIIGWIKNSGAKEADLEDLCQRFSHCWKRTNLFTQIKDILSRRADVRNVYPGFSLNRKDYDRFYQWLSTSGVKEENLERLDLEQYPKARGGYYKILNLYLTRYDLQKVFYDIHHSHGREKFVDWLKTNLVNLNNISFEEVLWFDIVCEYNSTILLTSNLCYNSWLRTSLGCEPNLFIIDKIFQILELNSVAEKNEVINFLASDDNINSLSQLKSYYVSQGLLKHLFPDAFKSRENLLSLYQYLLDQDSVQDLISQFKAGKKWIEKLELDIQTYIPTDKVINVAGYFDASTGMGQSARSMLMTLDAANLKYNTITLPNTHVHEDTLFEKSNLQLLMGWFSSEAKVNITVANADTIPDAHRFLPPLYWQGKRNIGYWVWETEELPRSYAKFARYFDEIWTPSEYSAAAIRKQVEQPVKVVPHVIDLDELSSVQGKREEFGLPEDRLLFGFFFDQKSCLQRKNPHGLIEAFRQAFGKSQEAYLVLKVNSPLPGNYDYEMLKLESVDLNVIWIEETFDRPTTLKLMDCLDVYVSLHRSEGFGLTLAESMAMGKPVIATNYSGNLEFMNSSNSLLVEADVISTSRNYGSYPKGTRWAEPNINSASKLMNSLIDLSTRKYWGRLAKSSIFKSLSNSVICKKYLNMSL